jgi:hypothetical protein
MLRRVLAGTVLVAAAGGAALIVLLVGGVFDRGGGTLTRNAYLTRLERLCREANRQLARIPPPANPSDPQELAQSIDRALPPLEEHVAAERKLRPPPELKAEVEHAFELTDESIRDLKESRRKALAGDRPGALRAFAGFLDARDRSRAAGRALGLRC